MKLLKDIGMPWAKVYPGSRRLTGELTAEPERDINGEVTHYRWVGDMTIREFDDRFYWEEHDAMHSYSNRDFHCPYCRTWQKRELEEMS